MLCLIFEILVTLIEVLLVLAAIFSHRVVQRNQLPVATNDEDGEAEQKGQEVGSVGAIEYRLYDLEVATDSFSEDNKLGKGGYGVVYKGLLGGKIVAVKKLFGSSAESDFANEASLLSSLKHANLIKFLGYCCEAGYYILVYEYASNGDLYNNLINKNKCRALNWEMRFEIIKGFARGLSYLHHSENMIIHRDLKPANVLLDEYYSAKIADFGLSRAFDMNKTHKTTKQIAGTMGYIAPELFFKQHYSTRSDVYSYGQIVLETLAGCTVQQYAQFNQEALSHVVWKQWKDKRPLREIIDSSLQDSCPQEQLMTCIIVGLLCVQHDPKKRPDMKLVLEMLNKKRALTKPSIPAFWEGYYETTTIQLQGVRQQDSNTSIQVQPPLSPKMKVHSKKRVRATIAGAFAAHCVPALTRTWWRRRRPHHHFFDDLADPEEDAEDDSQFGQLKRFSLHELQVATDNFNITNVLGRGASGKVYKGKLADGSLVAVKQSREDTNAKRELQFQTQMQMSSMTVCHNLLKLQGFCMTPTEWFLVYPYMANGSLASCLRERSENVPLLDWPRRRRIALGTARGLSYLHFHNPKIIHRDIKAANILLDEDLEAVVGDFGLAKLMNYQDTHITTAVRGTIGHIAPEYLSTGKSSERTDVFAYGITLLELITGQRAFDLARLAKDDNVMLLDWVIGLLRDKMLDKLVDPDLRNFPEMEVESLIQVALICTRASPLGRPKMSEVVQMLEGDGLALAERWEEWQEEEVRIQTMLAIRGGSNMYIDSTCNLSPDVLSAAR